MYMFSPKYKIIYVVYFKRTFVHLAGMAALPEEKRRQQIKRHLEQASSIHSWEIDPASIEICKREDGSDHLLGTGGYGQACLLLVSHLLEDV